VRPAPFRRLTLGQWLREASSELRKTNWLAVPAAAYDAALVALAVVALVAFIAGIDAGFARIATSIF
jgi:preprotein translocase subunit SecE